MKLAQFTHGDDGERGEARLCRVVVGVDLPAQLADGRRLFDCFKVATRIVVNPAPEPGPILALLNNIFEVRVDARKFLYVYQRGAPRYSTSINVWRVIFRFLSFAGVVMTG